MVSINDVIKNFERFEKEGAEIWCRLSEDQKYVISNKTGEVVCTVSEFAQHLREKLHCDFETVYDEHPSLFHVIRCKECGCVVFTYEDDRYDHKLCCPVCAGYETSFKYWTKESIDADPQKQEAVKLYEQMEEEKRRSYERRKKRGLNDWEICKKTIGFGDNVKRDYVLECNNFFRGKTLFQRLKGLNLHITKWEKDEDGCFIGRQFTRIPLSPYAAYIQWVVPYRKNAHPSIRKYYPWQKKPEKTM